MSKRSDIYLSSLFVIWNACMSKHSDIYLSSFFVIWNACMSKRSDIYLSSFFVTWNACMSKRSEMSSFFVICSNQILSNRSVDCDNRSYTHSHQHQEFCFCDVSTQSLMLASSFCRLEQVCCYRCSALFFFFRFCTLCPVLS